MKYAKIVSSADLAVACDTPFMTVYVRQEDSYKIVSDVVRQDSEKMNKMLSDGRDFIATLSKSNLVISLSPVDECVSMKQLYLQGDSMSQKTQRGVLETLSFKFSGPMGVEITGVKAVDSSGNETQLDFSKQETKKRSMFSFIASIEEIELSGFKNQGVDLSKIKKFELELNVDPNSCLTPQVLINGNTTKAEVSLKEQIIEKER